MADLGGKEKEDEANRIGTALTEGKKNGGTVVDWFLQRRKGKRCDSYPERY